MMSKIVFAVDEPHVVYSINERSKSDNEFAAGEWRPQAKMRAKAER
jgi:hypothetical protein